MKAATPIPGNRSARALSRGNPQVWRCNCLDMGGKPRSPAISFSRRKHASSVRQRVSSKSSAMSVIMTPCMPDVAGPPGGSRPFGPGFVHNGSRQEGRRFLFKGREGPCLRCAFRGVPWEGGVKVTAPQLGRSRRHTTSRWCGSSATALAACPPAARAHGKGMACGGFSRTYPCDRGPPVLLYRTIRGHCGRSSRYGPDP